MDHRLNPDEYSRLMEAAKRRAHELRRQAARDVWDGLGRRLRQAATAVATRAPRSSSTSSLASPGKSLPRQATC